MKKGRSCRDILRPLDDKALVNLRRGHRVSFSNRSSQCRQARLSFMVRRVPMPNPDAGGNFARKGFPTVEGLHEARE